MPGVWGTAGTVIDVCRQARQAASVIRELPTSAKDQALALFAGALNSGRNRLLAANSVDIDRAASDGVAATTIDRLTLMQTAITTMVNAIRTVIELPDPVGQVVAGCVRPNGLLIERVREPLGVVAVKPT